MEIRHISNHFAAASDAPTASLAAQRALSTSGKDGRLSGKRWRAEVIDCVLLGGVFAPRLVSVSYSGDEVSFGPLGRVFDLTVCNGIREIAYVLLECSIHELKAANQEIRVMVRRRDKKPRIGVPGRIGDETGKGFLEGAKQ